MSHRIIAPLATFTLVTTLTISAVIAASGRPASGLQPLSERSLAQIFGADQSQGANVTGDCDSIMAANNKDNDGNPDAPCDACTQNQARAGTLCDCCDNGGTINMMLGGYGAAATYMGINAKSVAYYDCGNLSYKTCVRVGGRGLCQGDAVPAKRSCGSVTEYSNQ